jgi:hypothetical protein
VAWCRVLGEPGKLQIVGGGGLWSIASGLGVLGGCRWEGTLEKVFWFEGVRGFLGTLSNRDRKGKHMVKKIIAV